MSDLLTTRGKAYALQKLAERRTENKDRPKPDNSSQPAGSPMVFLCIACKGSIVVPESYLAKPSLCRECEAMKELGWLE